MSALDALLLGLLQGLTEFLPVSSSGHIELGKALLGVDAENNLSFTIIVHGATVLSTLVVFRKEISTLSGGLLACRWNESSRYALYILLSMIPVGILGLLFKERVEAMFAGNVLMVGIMLCITALLLASTYLVRRGDKDIRAVSALVIGVAQALAVIPGISRSGSTIVAALLMGVRREAASRFSFLMVILPIIGANILDMTDGSFVLASADIFPLCVAFITAFITGVIACKWMISIVNKGKLIYFAVYCLLAGLFAIFFSVL